MTTTHPTTTTSGPTLLVGGTGRTGRRVAARLAALGQPVRIASRSGDPRFEWAEPTTWDAVLDGVGAAYVAYHPDLGFPGAAEVVSAFATAATRHGVTRLVLLSGRGEDGAARAEEAVLAVAPTTTVLRASWFAQNFSEHFLLDSVLEGVIALPADDVAEPFVDVDDVVDVAVAALLEPGHAGRRYELTGPELLTFADVAAELSRATGRTIPFVPVTPEEYAAGATAAGVPAEEVEPLLALFAQVLDGRNASVQPDVAQVLGRPARTFAAYASAAAASGVWSQSGVPSR